MRIDRDYVTVTQAAKLLGTGRSTIHHLIERKELRIIDREPFPGGERYWLSRHDVQVIKARRRRRRTG